MVLIKMGIMHSHSSAYIYIVLYQVQGCSKRST